MIHVQIFEINLKFIPTNVSCIKARTRGQWLIPLALSYYPGGFFFFSFFVNLHFLIFIFLVNF